MTPSGDHADSGDGDPRNGPPEHPRERCRTAEEDGDLLIYDPENGDHWVRSSIHIALKDRR